jgi:hypothetical protein
MCCASFNGSSCAADVKATNILVQREGSYGGMLIEQVQLADIEDAVYVPPGSDIVGKKKWATGCGAARKRMRRARQQALRYLLFRFTVSHQT